MCPTATASSPGAWQLGGVARLRRCVLGVASDGAKQSKLTSAGFYVRRRLLKDGLSGNSRTAMIAAISASSDQYQHAINTLKYADR